jgi:hypothetical protein
LSERRVSGRNARLGGRGISGQNATFSRAGWSASLRRYPGGLGGNFANYAKSPQRRCALVVSPVHP